MSPPRYFSNLPGITEHLDLPAKPFQATRREVEHPSSRVQALTSSSGIEKWVLSPPLESSRLLKRGPLPTSFPSPLLRRVLSRPFSSSPVFKEEASALSFFQSNRRPCDSTHFLAQSNLQGGAFTRPLDQSTALSGPANLKASSERPPKSSRAVQRSNSRRYKF